MASWVFLPGGLFGDKLSLMVEGLNELFLIGV
jgi:hypothetical protein